MNAFETFPRSDSITLKLNGEEIATGATTIAGLLAERDIDAAQPGIAVAVNDTVIPRSSWPERQIVPADRVEVITAMQGG